MSGFYNYYKQCEELSFEIGKELSDVEKAALKEILSKKSVFNRVLKNNQDKFDLSMWYIENPPSKRKKFNEKHKDDLFQIRFLAMYLLSKAYIHIKFHDEFPPIIGYTYRVAALSAITYSCNLNDEAIYNHFHDFVFEYL